MRHLCHRKIEFLASCCTTYGDQPIHKTSMLYFVGLPWILCVVNIGSSAWSISNVFISCCCGCCRTTGWSFTIVIWKFVGCCGSRTSEWRILGVIGGIVSPGCARTSAGDIRVVACNIVCGSCSWATGCSIAAISRIFGCPKKIKWCNLGSSYSIH